VENDAAAAESVHFEPPRELFPGPADGMASPQ